MADITLTIGANGSEAEAEIKRVQSVVDSFTARAKKRMSDFGSTFEDAARKLNRSQLASQLETISSLFIQVGGPISRLSVLMTSLIRPVSILGSIMPAVSSGVLAAGAAAASAAAGFGLSALAIAGIVSAAGSAYDELEKLKMSDAITDEQRGSVLAYREGWQSVKIAVDELWLAIGTDLMPALTLLLNTVAEGIGYLKDFAETASYTGRVLGAFATLGVSELIRKLYDLATAQAVADGDALRMADAMRRASAEAADQSNQIQRLANLYDEFGPMPESAAQSYQRLAAEQREAERAARELARTQEEQAQRSQEFDDDLKSLEHSLTMTFISGVRFAKGLEEELQKLIDDEKEFNANLEKSSEDALKHVEEMQEEFKAMRKENTMASLGEIDKYTGMVTDSIANLLEAQMMDHEQLLTRQTDRIEFHTDKRKGLVEALKDAETEAQRESLRSQIDVEKEKIANLRANHAKAKAEMLKTWRQQKALKITEVAIDAAVAFATTFAAVGFPAGLILGPLASAAVASQIPLIQKEQPPKFHTGGMVQSNQSEPMIRALPGEGVLSHRGVANVGGPAVVKSLNEGSSQPIMLTTTINLDGREIARHVQRYNKASQRNHNLSR